MRVLFLAAALLLSCWPILWIVALAAGYATFHLIWRHYDP